MRQVINVSLPEPIVKIVKRAVKQGNYSSTSEFFRALVRDWQAGRLLADLNVSRREIAAGKGRTLKSLKSLR
jgi:Arc/MetJ-type ribon-helix-helix transcriptional regulator